MSALLIKPDSSLRPWTDNGWGAPLCRNSHVEVAQSDRYYRILYQDGCGFIIDSKTHEVFCDCPPQFDASYIGTYLYGPVFGILQRLTGTTAIHGSAVCIEGKAILLMGPAGAGKSTTAAAFASLGYPVLADDVAALESESGEVRIQPAYPTIRLWDASVEALWQSRESLPLITEGWEKRFLDLSAPGYVFQDKPLPLGAVYQLSARLDIPEPQFTALAPREALLTLISNTYANCLPLPEMSAKDMKRYAQIVQSIPVRRIVPSSDISKLVPLVRAIAGDFATIDR